MDTIEILIAKLLCEIDIAPTREGLKGTPRRYEAFIKSFLSPSEFTPTVFDSEGYDEMIVQTNIPFYSLCEHHLLPFFGIGSIAYIPDKKIIGLSKLSRTLGYFSHRLQNQERLTSQVADSIDEILKPKGIGIILNGRHLCMEMRGVCHVNTPTTTSVLKGVFKTRAQTRSEFIALHKTAVAAML